jgi:diguanylate cyclase (GGDEF)-like protein/putative nucleotidyltransferase with HDIG domain
MDQELRLPARVYIAIVSLMGAIALGLAVNGWESADLLKFAGFLAVATLSAGITINVPGVVSTLPLTFLFVLFGVLELSGPETVILGSLVTLVQCYWNQSRRPGLDQIAFTVATMALAASAATAVYHSAFMASFVASFVAANSAQPLVRLAVATLVLFVANTAPVAIAVAIAESVPFFAIWRDCYFLSLSYYLGGGMVAELASLGSRILGWPTVLLTGPVVYLIFRFYRLHIRRIEDERQHMKDVSALHLRTIQALAMAIEAKDDTTSAHLARVQVYAREIARELGLTDEEKEALQAASILHDIGKLAVPEHIISKPGRLTPEEFEKMKIHPIVGAEILERVKFPYPVAPIVAAHHEKWDGSGYPNGLAGEAIPIGARILAVVDCLDALASDRQYRRALPLDEAMKVVEKDSGTAFDPRIVQLMSQRYVELEKMAREQSPPDSAKLSKDVKVSRGLAPAAGFEGAAASSSTLSQAKHTDFLSAIAAARQEVQTLFEISQDLGSSLSLNETLSVLGVKLRGIVPHHSLAIWICRDNALIPEYVAGDDFRLFSSLEIPMGQGLSGWVAENHMPILNGNPSVESGYLSDPARFSTLRSAVAVPLEGSAGIVGVLALYHADRDAFTKDHLRILLAMTSKIAFSIENALRFRQVESTSTTDLLTGLPNARALFLQLDGELSRSRRSQQPVAVLALDLDNFKQVNDHAGQLEGNRVLRAVATALKSVCREYDSVARMGGDEFVVVLAGPRPGEIAAKLQQMRDVIAQAGREVYIGGTLTVSIGAAHYPDDGDDADKLLSEADRRMYAEKRIHRERQRSDALTERPRLLEHRETAFSSR